MVTRPPAVAGMFYEAAPERLRTQVRECSELPPRTDRKEPFLGAVVPHAGIMYSGRVAAAFYDLADLPNRLIILCPNHTGLGHFAAINREGTWKTPLGEVPVDTELADELMRACPILKEDRAAHAREHSLEVQLPFLQVHLRDFSFVPICLGAPRYGMCVQIGEAIANVVAGKRVGIVASSDLNHYEDQAETLRKDQIAIDQVLALNPEELWRVVEDFDISMCGYIPTTTMLIAAKKLGATKAQLLKHATSGDVNADFGHVVGYASILIS